MCCVVASRASTAQYLPWAAAAAAAAADDDDDDDFDDDFFVCADAQVGVEARGQPAPSTLVLPWFFKSWDFTLAWGSLIRLG